MEPQFRLPQATSNFSCGSRANSNNNNNNNSNSQEHYGPRTREAMAPSNALQQQPSDTAPVSSSLGSNDLTAHLLRRTSSSNSGQSSHELAIGDSDTEQDAMEKASMGFNYKTYGCVCDARMPGSLLCKYTYGCERLTDWFAACDAYIWSARAFAVMTERRVQRKYKGVYKQVRSLNVALLCLCLCGHD